MADSETHRARERLWASELTRAPLPSSRNSHPKSACGLQWDGENRLVTIDVCELERIPNSIEMMATYVVQLDDQGKLVRYNPGEQLPPRAP
jgi:hypothetical protein